MLGIQLAEAGLVPDPLIRIAIRRLLRSRAASLAGSGEEQLAAEEAFREALCRGPIAIHTDAANAQHYEVPAAYFELVLGPRLKYSCGLWDEGTATLGQSEEAMLALTCERAGIRDGQAVLDLGCGWGSLSLWIAEHYPECRVLGVSNSKSQRELILRRAENRGLLNVDVVTANVNHFAPDRRFDRVVSVEMFEHVRNHELLMGRIQSWLEPAGKLFVHHFSHRTRSYPFETEGPNDWMGRHFFTGGMMPSHDLLLHYQRDLVLESRWRLDGRHYQKTCEAWLERHDARKAEILEVLAGCHGADEARRWFHRWRLFYLACAELFGFDGGHEWGVTHLLFGSQQAAA